MPPYQRATGAHARSQTMSTPIRAIRHRIDRPLGNSPVGRAVTARRNAILRRGLCEQLLASRVQGNRNQPTLFSRTYDDKPDDDFMLDGVNGLKNDVLVAFIATLHQENSTKDQSALLKDAPSASSPWGSSLLSEKHGVNLDSSVVTSTSASSSASSTRSIDHHSLTEKALLFLDSTTSTTGPSLNNKISPDETSVLSQDTSKPIDSHQSSSIQSSSRGSDSEDDEQWATPLVYGPPITWSSNDICEQKGCHTFKFSRNKREWIAMSVHRKGLYLCVGRYDAAVQHADSLCPKCEYYQSVEESEERRARRFSEVIAWLDGIDDGAEEKDASRWCKDVLGAADCQIGVV
ncbi:hypothetical protein B0T20DRAFT_478799 [Sordaria brevicollis]|uniref:Uncharacterized protein n=1 Tax=Sordaria brevicollis TaxID=83679 RepID=A0AAE0UCV0_SORBR|nr:hypothetical protein B0T20DRAFT_478799 [Sordaria brevicollis]